MTAQELGMLSMVPKYMVMALLHTMLQGTSVNMTPMNIVPLQKKTKLQVLHVLHVQVCTQNTIVCHYLYIYIMN